MSLAQSSQSVKPTVPYWHVWTDSDGVSHQTKVELTQFEFKTLEPPAAPFWADQMKAQGASVVIVVLPAGWRGEWHENSKPQWIVPLSGRWFVETMDGHRVEMGPGDLSFGEDQQTMKNSRGQQGHLSGVVGDQPCTIMLVELSEKPTLNQPGRFK